MPYPLHIKLDQSKQFLQNIEDEIEGFNTKVERMLRSTNLFEKDILDMNAAVNTLESLRAEGMKLHKLLNSIRRSKKQYAPNRRERESSTFQGAYGNLTGEVRKNIRTLNVMLKHLDFLIDTVKRSNNDKTRTTVAMATHLDQKAEQREKFGASFADPSDLIVAAALLLVAIKKLWQEH